MNLREQLKQAIKQLEAKANELGQLLAKKKSEQDEAKAKTITDAIAAKRSEIDNLKAHAQELRDQIELENEIAGLTVPDAPDLAGKSVTGGRAGDARQGAGAKVYPVRDQVKDEMAKRAFFLTYVQKGESALEGEAFNAISAEAKDSRYANYDAPNAVIVPKHISAEILNPRGKQVFSAGLTADLMARGKVILSTDATGGSTDSGANDLVPPDFRPELLKEEVYEPMLYDRVRVVQAMRGSFTYPMLDQDQGNHGGVAFTWKSTEGADKVETEPVFKDFVGSTHELSGWTEASLIMLRRSGIGLEQELVNLFRDAAKFEFSKMIHNGSGTNRPRGIIQKSGVLTVNRAVANQVSWGDLAKLEYALTKGRRRGGMFIEDDTVERYLKETVDGQGRPLFTADTANGPRNRQAGYDYLTHEFTPALGTKGDVIFGNPRAYFFGVEEDIAIARSEHAEFKKGRVVFRMIAHVGGDTPFPKAFALLDVPA